MTDNNGFQRMLEVAQPAHIAPPLEMPKTAITL